MPHAAESVPQRQGTHQSLENSPKVEGAREEARCRIGQQRQRCEIGIDRRLQSHVLNLHRDFPPVRQLRLVHLPQTPGPSASYPGHRPWCSF